MKFGTLAVSRGFITLAIVLVAVLCGCAARALAQSAPVNTFLGLDGKPSLVKPSVDNVLFWSDQHLFRKLRIQEHARSGECRLLDESGVTRARGTFEECLAGLESIKRAQNLPPMRGKAVVLLHGLAAPAWSMNLLARHLRIHGGYEVFTVDYASLRADIDYHGRSLARVIQGLEGFDEINLVGHSMGNIVIRRYLAGDESPSAGWSPDPRIHRVVMIAPPNHGSITAVRLANLSLFKSVFGQSGQQLGALWQQIEGRLAIPSVEFGIIAGGWKNQSGFDPFLPGDDDGRITVEETRLAGATDFTVVRALHEFIANDPRVFRYTLHFLTDGCFDSPATRESIPRDRIAQQQQSRTR
ncbi:MAG: esterase/lipase family protein [Planctomycetota bacterium]